MKIRSGSQEINTTNATVVLPAGEVLSVTCVLEDGSHRVITLRVSDFVAVKCECTLDTMVVV